MEEFHDIVTSVLDADGSCRDINFDCPTWAGLEQALKCLFESFGDITVRTDDGAEAEKSRPSHLVKSIRGGTPLHVLLSRGRGLFRNMQIFASKEENGSPFVELTFFSDDVEQSSTLRGDFIKWVETIRDLMAASRAYARFENASWKQGDVGPSSGVFLVA
jgi:hypothetical protein